MGTLLLTVLFAPTLATASEGELWTIDTVDVDAEYTQDVETDFYGTDTTHYGTDTTHYGTDTTHYGTDTTHLHFYLPTSEMLSENVSFDAFPVTVAFPNAELDDKVSVAVSCNGLETYLDQMAESEAFDAAARFAPDSEELEASEESHWLEAYMVNGELIVYASWLDQKVVLTEAR